MTPVELEKIFYTDTNLPLKTTKKCPIDSRRDIDAELARWGISKVLWEWNLDVGLCKITFELPADKFHDMPLAVQLEPPRIWRKKGKYKDPEIDWRVSVRLLYWFVHYQLAWVYANQSSSAIAFLPHIQVGEGKNVTDVVLPHISNLKALPDIEQPRPRIIEVKDE